MIYIDCGFFEGRALEVYRDKDLIDETWRIYAFEPNPDIDIKITSKKIDLPIISSNKAIWTKNGKTVFNIGGRRDSASIQGTSGHDNPREVMVECLDFSKFVSELPDEPIICNMDIEGAEFAVLRKMIKDGSIDKIDILDIEFHHRLMLSEEKTDVQELIEELRKHDVKVILKVDL